MRLQQTNRSSHHETKIHVCQWAHLLQCNPAWRDELHLLGWLEIRRFVEGDQLLCNSIALDVELHESLSLLDTDLVFYMSLIWHKSHDFNAALHFSHMLPHAFQLANDYQTLFVGFLIVWPGPVIKAIAMLCNFRCWRFRHDSFNCEPCFALPKLDVNLPLVSSLYMPYVSKSQTVQHADDSMCVLSFTWEVFDGKIRCFHLISHCGSHQL